MDFCEGLPLQSMNNGDYDDAHLGAPTFTLFCCLRVQQRLLNDVLNASSSA
jgi:hypothetical protein